MNDSGPGALVERLCRAVNAHDLDAIVNCFAPDYRNETPAHPNRGFTGREQVRSAVEGDTVWSEWEHRGTRPDGSPHLLRGVVILGVERGLAAWARFYMEPVEHAGDDVDEFRRRQLGVERS